MRELAYGHWVRTADGSIGRVKDIYRGNADVAIDGRNSETVNLPVTELRRIADPAAKMPPIEGLPPVAERPRCPMCDKPLRPWVTSHFRPTNEHNPLTPRVLRRVFDGKYHERYGFCTWGCAGEFARAAHKAGYRIQRKGA